MCCIKAFIEKKISKSFPKNNEKEEKHIEITRDTARRKSYSNSFQIVFKITVLGKCQENVRDCDDAQECGIDKSVLCKWKIKEKTLWCCM